MSQAARAVLVSPREWLRGPAIYTDGWIELDRGRAELYQPMTEAGLVFELADMRTPDDAVAFTRHRGLLWHGDAGADLRERFTEWEDVALGLRGLLLLATVLRHADGGDVDALDELRERWAPVLSSSFEAPAKDDAELLVQAGVSVAWGVSEGLAGAEQRLDCAACWGVGKDGTFGRPSQFLLNVQAQHLVHYAYHELALLLAHRVPTRACAACGRFYVIEDPRQRYCSRSCSGRARQRRYRAERAGSAVDPLVRQHA